MTSFETVKDWYESAVRSSYQARLNAERDRDYYDGYQWTDAEIKELQKRKQSPHVSNRIKPKIDALKGLEIRSRTDPKAFPRTPNDEQFAEAATDAIRFVLDNNEFDEIRSKIAEEVFIEGTGAAIVDALPKKKDIEVVIKRIPWDRYFIDQHSSELDHSDKRFDGMHLWMDSDQAKAMFPDADESLFSTKEEPYGDTFDDKPRFSYTDAGRDRIRVIQMYYWDKGWKRCYFTGHGFLSEPEDSPYVDEDGEPVNPIESRSAYIDRNNDRYGIVRQYISIQDEINKRRSKALHLLSVRQLQVTKGAVENINDLRREFTKPDGVIVTPPGAEIQVLQTADLAAGQFSLLQEAKSEIDAVGVNAALTGTEEQNLSGRALRARQDAGTLELAPVLDGIRDWQRRIYKQVWYRIKQFWTEERWIRITDDERNLKFVGLNRPMTNRDMLSPEEVAMAEQIPELAYRLDEVVQIENPVGEMMVDIILEDAPDIVNIQAEQFELLANMFQANPNAIPFDMLIEMSSLRNKDKILDRLNGGDNPQQQAMLRQRAQMQERAQVAQISKDEAKAALDAANAEQATVETQLALVGAETL